MDSYAFTCYVRDLPAIESEAKALEAKMRLEGRVAGAARVAAAASTLKRELLAMGVYVAEEGTRILREKERGSRLRPDTGGGGGERLEDHLVCDPIPSLGGIGWGSVGIANETELDADVEWWWTQESGYDGHVGRVLYGVFMPGEAHPSAEEFRQHPLFEARGKGEDRGSGVIRNPIPARHFVQDAIPEIEAIWHARFATIKAAWEAELLVAQTIP